MAKKKQENKQVLETQMDEVAKLCARFELDTLNAIFKEGMKSLSEENVTPLLPAAVASAAVGGTISACATVIAASQMAEGEDINEEKMRKFLTDICTASIEDAIRAGRYKMFNTKK